MGKRANSGHWHIETNTLHQCTPVQWYIKGVLTEAPHHRPPHSRFLPAQRAGPPLQPAAPPGHSKGFFHWSVVAGCSPPIGPDWKGLPGVSQSQSGTKNSGSAARMLIVGAEEVNVRHIFQGATNMKQFYFRLLPARNQYFENIKN